jgi:serine protease Do
MQFKLHIMHAARCAALLLAPGILAAQGPMEEQAPPVPPPPPPVTKVMLAGSGTFLGVGVREIDAERSKALNLKEEYGVEVTMVEGESPAAKAGFKVGDVVLEYNGQRVEGTQQFIRLVKETPAGRAVKLLVSRGGATQTIAATLAARKGNPYTVVGPMEGYKFEMRGMPGMSSTMPDIPKATMSWRSASLGVEAESLGESQLASFFGVKEGVLVRSVMKGTAAERAGIKAGDVIVKVDDAKVSAPRDVTSAMRSARSESKKSISIVLMRDRKESSVTVTLDDDQSERTPTPRSQKVTVRESPL